MAVINKDPFNVRKCSYQGSLINVRCDVVNVAVIFVFVEIIFIDVAVFVAIYVVVEVVVELVDFVHFVVDVVYVVVNVVYVVVDFVYVVVDFINNLVLSLLPKHPQRRHSYLHKTPQLPTPLHTSNSRNLLNLTTPGCCCALIRRSLNHLMTRALLPRW